MSDLQSQINGLLALVPEDQRDAAAELMAQYGPRLFELAKADAMNYLRRLLAGDFEAALELDAKLSDAEWLAQVAANTAAWQAVATSEQAKKDLRIQIGLRLVPIIGSILAALVGLPL